MRSNRVEPGTDRDPTMALRKLILAMAILAGFPLVLSQPANAFELTGAWATNAAQCPNIFARTGRARQVGFASFSRIYGGGFIAEANHLKGKFSNCLIKSRKESGQTINLIVACASGIMLSDVQFFLKVVDDNTIAREFPGMEEAEVSYHRCHI